MRDTAIHLDHVFVFTDPGADVEAASLARAGLVESYRRRHPGQGTANRCYCFDNAYLELLWVTDAAALASPPIAPTGLARRAGWRRNGASPFGIAIRIAPPDAPPPFAAWVWAPPYLPPGNSILVAERNAELRQPFLFRSPGDARPDAWTDGRAGDRQRFAGLAEIAELRLELPSDPPPAPEFLRLQESGILTVAVADDASRMVLTLSRFDGRPPRRLSLPDFAWLD
jgi:hypothetical protein